MSPNVTGGRQKWQEVDPAKRKFCPLQFLCHYTYRFHPNCRACPNSSTFHLLAEKN
jgi:hypothetical protein